MVSSPGIANVFILIVDLPASKLKIPTSATIVVLIIFQTSTEYLKNIKIALLLNSEPVLTALKMFIKTFTFKR